MLKNKILVIGSANIDLIMKMEHLPTLGETVTDAEFMQVYGGKGANQAVGAARAGGEVIFVNCVGDDAYSPQMLQNFKDDGIDTQYVFQEKGTPSGHALIMIGEAGHNYLSVAPGANYCLTRERIEEALPAIEQAGIIVLQYEIPQDTIEYVIDLASERGIPTMWNFAPARTFERKEYIGKVTILVVNEVEAEFLSSVKVNDKASAAVAAKALLEKGSKIVIITLGSEGALAFEKDKSFYIPAFQVDAVDTTAAGDVFCGSFAVALIEGKDIKEGLRFANAASALSVMTMGAQPSAPKRKEIDRFLEKFTP